MYDRFVPRSRYLTNKQARAFDYSSMDRMLQAMEVPPPRLVINLSLNSFVATRKTAAMGCNVPFSKETKGRTSTVITHHIHAEVDISDLLQTDRRLGIFFEECLLPVAIATQALVIIHTDNDVLSQAFTKVCSKYAKSMGGSLPFAVLSFIPANWVYGCSITEGTVAYAMSRESKRWRANKPKFESVMPNEFLKMSMQDMPEGCTHYIIVESIQNGKQDDSPLATLKANFVQRLQEQLPSIAVMTCRAFRLDWVTDYIARGLPMLMLDSRPPPEAGYADDIRGAEADLIKLSERLIEVGTVDHYDISYLAHLHAVLTKMRAKAASSQSKVRHSCFEESRLRSISEELEMIDERITKQQEGLVDEIGSNNQDKKTADSTQEALLVFEGLKRIERQVEAMWDLQSLKAAQASLDRIEDVAALNVWLQDVSCEHQYHRVPHEV